MESRELTIQDVPVRWEESGDGFPVVFLHGIPTSPALWRHVIPAIDGAWRLALEYVGYGWSIPNGRERDISVARQAEYLLAWLDALDIDRAVLVGHDLGGGTAQIAAVRAPDRCAGLVLTNSIAYDSWPIPSVKALRAAAGVVRNLPGGSIYPVMATLLFRGHDDRGRARDALATHWRPYSTYDAAAALARQVRSLDVQDTLAVADRLPGLDVPARIVWGAADRFQKVRYGERLAADLRTHLWRIEGGKHFVPEDHPEDIVEAVAEVLKEL